MPREVLSMGRSRDMVQAPYIEHLSFSIYIFDVIRKKQT